MLDEKQKEVVKPPPDFDSKRWDCYYDFIFKIYWILGWAGGEFFFRFSIEGFRMNFLLTGDPISLNSDLLTDLFVFGVGSKQLKFETFSGETKCLGAFNIDYLSSWLHLIMLIFGISSLLLQPFFYEYTLLVVYIFFFSSK